MPSPAESGIGMSIYLVRSGAVARSCSRVNRLAALMLHEWNTAYSALYSNRVEPRAFVSERDGGFLVYGGEYICLNA
ncbi:MAG: hypothetical protein PWQ93_497 [Clostridiales bacterium]|nr:hypothetical protein [Clostridiales bacterium]